MVNTLKSKTENNVYLGKQHIYSSIDIDLIAFAVHNPNSMTNSLSTHFNGQFFSAIYYMQTALRTFFCAFELVKTVFK